MPTLFADCHEVLTTNSLDKLFGMLAQPLKKLNHYMYIRMYVRMHVYMYVYVYMYVCTYVRTYVRMCLDLGYSMCRLVQ